MIVGIDRGGTHAHPFCCRDLVAHQREKRRDQQSWAFAGFAQQLGGDEIDEALAPASLLHDQQAALAFDDVAYRLFLAVAKADAGNSRTDTEKLEAACRIINHGEW